MHLQKPYLTILFYVLLLGVNGIANGQTLDDYSSYLTSENSVTILSTSKQKLKISSYGEYMARIQVVRDGEEFFSDDHYEMVANHKLGSKILVKESDNSLELRLEGERGITIIVKKKPLRLQFKNAGGVNVLEDNTNGIRWDGSKITANFSNDESEHFCGLGYPVYGRVTSLDLRGQTISRNYGGGQAPMVVTFYMSGKGYGIFLNSTFPNTFSFGKNSSYYISIDDLGYKGRMDYFFIGGDDMKQTLDHYLSLTGRPRLPQKSIFGWQLSDRHKQGQGESWWKETIKKHRDAGYSIDVIINDNSWRAGGGGWSGSRFEFDKTKYPDPPEYKRWCESNGLVVSLDLNRNNNDECEGWNKSFNIPNTQNIPYPTSVPDYTSKAVQDWTWKLFWNKAFNPSLKYPGDAIWLDETDELGNIPADTKLANGRHWAEMENYYPFLI